MTRKPAGKEPTASGRDALPPDSAASANRQYINLARLPFWRSAWSQSSEAPTGERDVLRVFAHAMLLLALIFAFGWIVFLLQR